MLRDLIVQLDASERSWMRLDLAIAIAKRSECRIVGVLSQSDPGLRLMSPRDRKQRIAELETAIGSGFKDRVGAAGLPNAWRNIAAADPDQVTSEFIAACHVADMAIMGQYHRDYDEVNVPETMNEEVVLHAGRPVLFVPAVGTYTDVGRNITIAWNGSRESARAVSDALSLLQKADRVRVVGFHRPGGKHASEEEVVAYLATHGVEATRESLGINEIGVMDALLSRTADHGADLLVMGAHGNYGFPNLRRGSGTRYVLRHMPLPVMMSH